jgi:hypothetical protein
MWTVPRDWAGETVTILAGGPSVLSQDLSLLTGRRVIAINSAWKTWPQGRRPVLRRHQMVDEVPSGFRRADRHDMRMVGQAHQEPEEDRPRQGIATKPDTLALAATSVTGAINLAVHFGAAKSSCSASTGRSSRARHHHGDAYPWPFKGCFDRHAAEFKAIARPSRAGDQLLAGPASISGRR